MGKKNSLAQKTIKSKIIDIVQKIPSVRFESEFFLGHMTRRFLNFGIEVTNVCNANCSFCAYKYMTRDKVFLPDSLFKKAISNYSEIGGGPINLTPFGEILVDKEIIEKIEYCSQFGNIGPIFFYTNAISLNKFDFESLLRSGVDIIKLSTHLGNRHSYKKYYGVNAYESVINNIITISKMNKEMGNPVRVALHLRCERPYENVFNSEIFQKISKYINKDNIILMDEYESIQGKIEEENIPTNSLITNRFISRLKQSPCFELYRRFHIYSNGDVGFCPCIDFDAELIIGNIKKDDLLSIWSGKVIKKYRDNWYKGKIPEICLKCARYQPISEFIRRNRVTLIRKYILNMNIVKK